MKAKITLIIAAFAVLVSFAFITVNKEAKKSTSATATVEQTQPMSGYAMEDKNQWD